MAYRVENIGGAFNKKGVNGLGEYLTTLEREGWSFEFAFPVQETGCLGLRGPQTTLAVFHHPEPTSDLPRSPGAG